MKNNSKEKNSNIKTGFFALNREMQTKTKATQGLKIKTFVFGN